MYFTIETRRIVLPYFASTVVTSACTSDTILSPQCMHISRISALPSVAVLLLHYVLVQLDQLLLHRQGLRVILAVLLVLLQGL
jgi:hypothetical protein